MFPPQLVTLLAGKRRQMPMRNGIEEMGQQACFHAPHGGADFLGWRKRGSATEIVYDDGVTRRMIWRVANEFGGEERLSDALRTAVGNVRVVATLYDELKKRAIAIERI